MMEEFAYRAVERVGFPIAVSIISFWAVYRLFLLRESDRDKNTDRMAVALGFNTAATHELSETMKKSADSEGKICQYNPATIAAAAAAAAAAAVEQRHNERNLEQTRIFKEELAEIREHLSAKENPV